MLALCSQCDRRNQCKTICEALNKEITGRGITAHCKPKTYTVDFSYIEGPHPLLNSFQKSVLSAMKSFALDMEAQWIDRLTVDELIGKSLTDKGKQALSLTLEGWTQGEIAGILGMSQPSVSLLINEEKKNLIEKAENLYC